MAESFSRQLFNIKNVYLSSTQEYFMSENSRKLFAKNDESDILP